MGHKEDTQGAWIKLHDSLKNTVCNKIKSVNSQIGDTLTMNTVAISSANFVASFQAIPPARVLKLETLINKFIRNNSSLISLAKRCSSPKDGQIIPLLRLQDVITTIRAKWILQLFHSGKWTTDKVMWLKQLIVMYRQYKFPTVYHMLNSNYNLPMKSKSIQRANFSHYTHDCVKSFIKMNFD